MSMPEQKPGRSKQNYGTPLNLLSAIKQRLRIADFTWDLAADASNSVCSNGRYFGLDKDQDSLTIEWASNCTPYTDNMNHGEWLWLNPPFADIRPWAEKAYAESCMGAHIIMLVPASVGAGWWRDWVEGKSYQWFMNGRPQFIGGEGLYPKDCALVLYTPEGYKGNEVWTWK